MGKFNSIIFLCAFALCGSGMAASNTNCYSIKDHDRRVACLSEGKKDASGCASIRSHDKRNMCSAAVKGKKSDCYAIRNKDDRNACLAGMPY